MLAALRLISLIACLAIAPVAARAGNETVELKDLGWLAGGWAQEQPWRADEVWTEPAGGIMQGMFRMVVDGDFAVAEFMLLQLEEDIIVLSFKHFRRDYSTWEASEDPPNRLKLIKAGDQHVRFENVVEAPGAPAYLDYKRDGDKLVINVGIRDDAGQIADPLIFNMERR